MMVNCCDELFNNKLCYKSEHIMNQIYSNWVYGSLCAGLLLLILIPLHSEWHTSLTSLFYLTLPFYMIHQYEEWKDDRFRIFINSHFGDGANILTDKAGFMINVLGVWGIISIAMYLCVYINLGFGLIATYLVLVNAIFHIAAWIVFRLYNPGLYSALGLFLPISVYTLYLLSDQISARYHFIGFLSAMIIHLIIIFYVLRFRKRSNMLI